MNGISLPLSHLPTELVERHDLTQHLRQRGLEAEPEVWFLRQQRNPMLPIWYQGEMDLLPWGIVKDRKHFWECRQESLEEGRWNAYSPQLVEIPAVFMQVGRVWTDAGEGIRGVVAGHGGQRAVFILTCPPTHYFEVMSGLDREPVMVGEQI